MYSWDCVRKALGHDHSRIVYLEEQLASLVDQSEDLKNEINSLKMIAEDVRPVMSPDKAFELLLNEVSLLFRRIATEDTEVIKVKRQQAKVAFSQKLTVLTIRYRPNVLYPRHSTGFLTICQVA